MGAGEINVAYDGTFGDLGAAEDVRLFDDGFDYPLMDVTEHAFTSANHGTVNPSTVSPKDLLNDVSVPPSSSFTNLTTPGSTVIETPDEYQTSPLFTDSMTADNNWYSLFPESDTDHATTSFSTGMTRTTSTTSVSQIMVHPGGEGTRKRASTTVAPVSPVMSPRHSTVAGVNARKRDKPLPPIVVDESDTVALKRARNTAAARKSRAKKVQERDDLESQIAFLQGQVDYWKKRALGHDASEASE